MVIWYHWLGNWRLFRSIDGTWRGTNRLLRYNHQNGKNMRNHEFCFTQIVFFVEVGIIIFKVFHCNSWCHAIKACAFVTWNRDEMLITGHIPAVKKKQCSYANIESQHSENNNEAVTCNIPRNDISVGEMIFALAIAKNPRPWPEVDDPARDTSILYRSRLEILPSNLYFTRFLCSYLIVYRDSTCQMQSQWRNS